jgi:hypothetical protein
LQEGQRVFVNYNFEKPTQVGFWYEAVVEAKPSPRRKTFTATVKMDAEAHEHCQVQLQFSVYELREPLPKTSRDPSEKSSDESFYPR